MTKKSKRPDRTGRVRPDFNTPGHVVLCLLVSVALHLCGCSSSRLTVSTNNTQAGKASGRKVDSREAPEVKELAERARRIGNEMYPKILALLADDSSKLPRQFDIVFKKHLERNFGQTVGATINLRAGWFAKNPAALDETLIHEMSHVAQKYPSKAWDYWGEGIADYVCYKLEYTNEWHWPHCSFEYPHYTSGYCCAGAFLMFADATYGSNVVRQLNTELRRGSYSDSFFAKATAKSMDALWTEQMQWPGETLTHMRQSFAEAQAEWDRPYSSNALRAMHAIRNSAPGQPTPLYGLVPARGGVIVAWASGVPSACSVQ